MKRSKILNQIGVIFVTCLLLLTTFSISYATNWYVDNTASGSHNGTSWANAWPSFATIAWGTGGVVAGDTVYISGGSTGNTQTYTGMIQPTASGSVGNPITIKPGQDSSHNGIVLIDNNYNASYWIGILITGVQYITIDGRVGTNPTPHIKVTRAYAYGILVGDTGTRHIDIGYVESSDNGDPTTLKQGSSFNLYNNVDCETDIVNLHNSILHGGYDEDITIRGARYCDKWDVANISYNELYYGAENSITLNGDGVNIFNNWFHNPVAPQRGGNHYNCIQTDAKNSYTRIYNNYFDDIPPEGRTTDAPIRWAPAVNGSAHVRIFNNLFVSTTALTDSTGAANTMPFLTMTKELSANSQDDMVVANNTFVGSPGFAILTGGSSMTWTGVYILNNIITNSGRDQKGTALNFSTDSGTRTYGSYGDGKSITFDGNLFWPGTDGVNAINIDANYYTYSTFKTACYSLFGAYCNNTGVNSDPLLDASYIPTVSSPARAAGINLTSYCTETPAMCLDRAGNARPTSGAWDIGAYEYGAGSSVTQSTLLVTSINGTATSNPSGINCGSTCSANYDSGKAVTLTASPNSGYTFTGWSGGGCSGTGTCTVTMDAAKSVTASFATTAHNLTVTKPGTGTGTVTGNDALINCGSTCSVNYASGKSVTLAASATSGATFSGWSGGGCSGTGTCTVTMTAATSVTATFIPVYNLAVKKSVTAAGNVTSNDGTINCGSTCSANYNPGKSVTSTASTNSGYTFTGWSGGGCSGTGTCIVTMDAAKSVTASFATTQYNLTVTKSVMAPGTVTGSDGLINCGSTCSVNYASGKSVTLAASGNRRSIFAGWSGACSGRGTCTVSMTEVKSVKANFLKRR